MSLRHVVLPEPEGPSMAKKAPGATSRSTASMALTRPKCLETDCRETAGVIGGPSACTANPANLGSFPRKREPPFAELAAPFHNGDSRFRGNDTGVLGGEAPTSPPFACYRPPITPT